MIKSRWIMLAVLAVALALGCATVPSVPPSEAETAAKRYAPAEGQANIYVSRTDESLGKAVGFDLFVDQVKAVTLTPGTFTLVPVAPGSHVIKIASPSNSMTATLQAVAGKNYFYQVTPKASAPFTVVPEISLVILEPMGKMMINQSRFMPVTGQ